MTASPLANAAYVEGMRASEGTSLRAAEYCLLVHVAALLPQIITAVSTLGGVVLTLIITGRREGKRIAQQMSFERDKILADVRRELFIKTAHAMQRTREAVRVEHVSQGPAWEAWRDHVTRTTDHLFMLETELRVLAPELVPQVQQVAKTARLVRSAQPEVDQHELNRLIERIRTDSDAAMAQMRKLLGTETEHGGVMATKRN